MSTNQMNMDMDLFRREMEQNGFYLLENALPPDFVQRLKEELEVAIEKEESYHGGKDYQDYGMVLLCCLYGGGFLDLLELPQLFLPFEYLMGEDCILYSYTSTSMPPNRGNYSTRIHSDCRIHVPGYYVRVGAMILLDDFNKENGATWYLPASHLMAEPPDEDYFYRNAERLTHKAGSIWFANPGIYHAGGVNKTDRWRHALTIGMCPAYMKQRLDVPRAMAHLDLSRVSEKVKQKLGFYAQPPASYDEYYLPPEQRTFRQKIP